MAYFSQEMKKERVALLKPIMKKYGMKASYGVRHHSSFVINIKSGALDIIGNYNENVQPWSGIDLRPASDYIQVNNYWLDKNYSGEVLAFLKEVFQVANAGNFDKSDIMTDYFHVGFYVDINVGSWDKPYELVGE